MLQSQPLISAEVSLDQGRLQWEKGHLCPRRNDLRCPVPPTAASRFGLLRGPAALHGSSLLHGRAKLGKGIFVFTSGVQETVAEVQIFP